MKNTINENWLNKENGKYRCPHCEKEYTKKGISTHIWRSHGEGKKFTGNNKGYEDGTRKGTNKFIKAEQLGKDKPIVSEETKNKMRDFNIGRKHTEETKKKISESRTKFLKENPDKVPYVLNHYSKGESYPEEYFRKVLENNNIIFAQEKRESLYSLDFVINNIDLEIDGEQHYLDKKIVESDKKRTVYLKNIGYETIRIRWSEYKKLNDMDKKLFIDNLINKLTKKS